LGSFVKHGMDRQEDALKAGARPAWPHAADWGLDDGAATLTLARGDTLSTMPCPLLEAGLASARTRRSVDTPPWGAPGAGPLL
jgi:hypothetical protein